MKSKKNLTWMIPEVVAPITFLGSLAISLASGNNISKTHSILLWGLCAASFIVAVIGAVIKIRRKKDDPPQDPLLSHDQYEENLKKYLNEIIKKFKYLPLRSVDTKSADPDTPEKERLQMADVYIDMDTTTQIEIETEKDAIQLREKKRPITSMEALHKNSRMVLTGGPGSGKSTFVNHLAYCLASEKISPGKNWLGRVKQCPVSWSDMIPVPVALRDVAAWFGRVQPPERRIGMFEEYLKFWLKNMGLEDFQDALLARLRNGEAILFLDGLDEIAVKEDILEAIKEMCDHLPSAYPGPMLVTCRVLSYEDPRWQLASKTWAVFQLAKLDEEKINYFITAWHHQLEDIHVVGDADQASEKLMRAVKRPDLREFATNPLLLTVMALVHTQKGELPDARVLLYEAVVELLLWKWEGIKLQEADGGQATLHQLLREAGAREIDLKKVLWKLAFDVHGKEASKTDDEVAADISQSELIESLRELHPERSLDWSEKVVGIMQVRAGLLVEGISGTYSFPHRTFQEYLAGRHLSLQPDFADKVIQLSEQGAFWREAILMAVGCLTHEGRVDTAFFLAGELSPATAIPLDDENGWRQALLAGYCLNEIGFSSPACRKGMGQQITTQVKGNLQTLVSTDRIEPKERAVAGSFLGAMGGWPDDLDAMVFVPEGEFIMGSSAAEVEPLKEQNSVWEEEFDSETPVRSVFSNDFSIGKYLVTNSQYAEFVASTDHRPPEHWKGRKPPVEWLTHPVVEVSWHDANEYCRWLSEEKGREFRLPSEAEWEKAARGENGFIYPWGNEFDSGRCNMGDTGIRATSPVGIFNGGKSPYGCMDMSGNVMEWCGTKWMDGHGTHDEEMDEDVKGDDRRVLRGGGFWDSGAYVRCAFRDWYDPDSDIGFRVVSPGR